MAEVRIGDIVVKPPQFSSLVAQSTLTTNAFFQSGVLQTNPDINNHVNSGLGQTITLPHYNALDASGEANISTDDPAVYAVPAKMTTDSQTARKIMLNAHWKSMNLIPSMNGRSDPLSAGAQ